MGLSSCISQPVPTSMQAGSHRLVAKRTCPTRPNGPVPRPFRVLCEMGGKPPTLIRPGAPGPSHLGTRESTTLMRAPASVCSMQWHLGTRESTNLMRAPASVCSMQWHLGTRESTNLMRAPASVCSMQWHLGTRESTNLMRAPASVCSMQWAGCPWSLALGDQGKQNPHASRRERLLHAMALGDQGKHEPHASPRERLLHAMVLGDQGKHEPHATQGASAPCNGGY
jgi:hypothetical protein